MRQLAAFPGTVAVQDLALALDTHPALLLDKAAQALDRGVLVLTDEGLDFGHASVRERVRKELGHSALDALRVTAARALADRGAPPVRVAELLAAVRQDPLGWERRWTRAHAARVLPVRPAVCVRLLARVLSGRGAAEPETGLGQGPRSGAGRDPRGAAGSEARRDDGHGGGPRGAEADPSADLRVLLGRALLWSGATDAARVHAEAMLSVCELPHVRREFHLLLAERALLTFEPGRAEEHLAASEGDAAQGGPDEAATARALRALLCLQAGDPQRAAELIGDESALLPAHARAYEQLVRAILRYLRQQFSAALALLDRADAVIKALGGHPTLEAVNLLMWAECLGSNGEDARASVEAARQRATALGAGLLPWLHTIAAEQASRAGRWDEARAEVEAALALDDRHGFDGPLHALAAVSELIHGELAAARCHLRRAEEARPVTGVAAFYEAHAASAAILLAERENRREDALALVRRAVESGLGAHGESALAWLVPHCVRVAVLGDDRELAERLTAAANRPRPDGDSPGWYALELYCRGFVQGEAPTLIAASQALIRIGRPLHAAAAAEHAACLLAAAGEAGAAKEAAQRALNGYDSLGAHGEADRARAALRRYGIRPGARGARGRPSQGLASLTDTERRIAALVSAGHSNRHIADVLLVSPRTVQWHVGHILRKLGAASRVEIATLIATGAEPEPAGRPWTGYDD